MKKLSIWEEMDRIDSRFAVKFNSKRKEGSNCPGESKEVLARTDENQNDLLMLSTTTEDSKIEGAKCESMSGHDWDPKKPHMWRQCSSAECYVCNGSCVSRHARIRKYW